MNMIATISRAEHNARVERGEKAAGRYAFIGYNMDGTLAVFDVRDADDSQVEYGATVSDQSARDEAVEYGATFFVSEF